MSQPGARPSTHVRLSEKEFLRISNDSQLIGESIPWLLKRAYFKGPIVNPLMDKDSAVGLMKELNRIGTNINQIAKHLNSGFREGWNQNFVSVQEDLQAIRKFIAGFHGIR